jgi:exosortase A-associated hydrolase 1
MREEVLEMRCEGEQLVGILHRPLQPGGLGLVIIVGGPQYRVGSHRQFIHLARHVATAGHAVLRFDCRGMGDSTGEFPGFEQIGPDVGSAVDALFQAAPGLQGVVLWGLCDAASAALFYAPTDARVRGVALANPWVRTEETLARTVLRHYYLRRLFSRDFWRKLLTGGVRPAAVAGDLAGNLRAGLREAVPGVNYVERMRLGLAAFGGPVLELLSGRDTTAAEYESVAATPAWQRLVGRPGVERHRVAEATHTFSTAAWRDEVAERTLRWMDELAAGIERRA